MDTEIALIAFDWNNFRPNYGTNKKIYDSLIAANVPSFETGDSYTWSMLYPRGTMSLNRESYIDPSVYSDQKVESIRGWATIKTPPPIRPIPS